jgi:glutathione peroxidase-family protein
MLLLPFRKRRAMPMSFHSFTLPLADGREQPLEAYRGRHCLLVNVASA